MKHGTLVLVRHGESRLNELNRFSGWLDIPLSKHGVDEAQSLAVHCERFRYTAAFTSDLERAHQTLLIILSYQKKIGIFSHGKDKRYNHLDHLSEKLQHKTIPIFGSEALNERAYGELQGLNKRAADRLYGKAQVFQWRRGFIDRPPGGESLKDVFDRVVPYFKSEIHPRVHAGGIVLVVAHGNTIRALMKYFEQIKDDQIPFVDLPTAHPLIYEYRDGHYHPRDGHYQFSRPLR